MRYTILVTIFISIIIACNQQPDKLQLGLKKDSQCVEDSILVSKILSENLLFNKAYVLHDSINEYIMWRDSTGEEHAQIIQELIERDSIPSSIYSACSELKNWDYNGDIVSVSEADLIDYNNGKSPFGNLFMNLKKETGLEGFIQTSRIFYSNDKSYAVVGLMIACGSRCGQHIIRLYSKRQHNWSLGMNYIISES